MSSNFPWHLRLVSSKSRWVDPIYLPEIKSNMRIYIYIFFLVWLFYVWLHISIYQTSVLKGLNQMKYIYLHSKSKVCNSFFKANLDTSFLFPSHTSCRAFNWYTVSWPDHHRTIKSADSIAASLLRAAKEVGKLNDRLVREEVCGFPTGNSYSHNVVVCTK